MAHGEGALNASVVAVGLVRAFQPAPPNPRSRLRPARPGCSVGFRDPGNTFVMAGTFGVGQLLTAVVLYLALERRHADG